MAKNKNKKKTFEMLGALKEDTKLGVMSIIFSVLFIFFVLAAFGKAGVVGDGIFSGLDMFLGVGYFILPLLFILLSISFFHNSKPELARTTIAGAILFFLSSLGVIDIIAQKFANKNLGGVMGKLVSMPVMRLFDFWIGVVILVAMLVISISIMFDKRPTLSFLRLKKTERDGTDSEDEIDEEEYQEEEEDTGEEDNDGAEEEEEKPKSGKIKKIKDALGIGNKDEVSGMAMNPLISGKYSTPPLTLLSRDIGKPGVGDIKANSNVIKRTLQNFGITVEMDEVSIGPSVTRYALKPAEGVKISRIVGLQNDLSLALAAHPLRIEAPIPGKSLVGIEIPNSTKTTVGLGTLLSAEEYQNSSKPLLVSLGRGISGVSHFADIAKMPHLLIAGATGSGKSVTIHTLIMSLLFRNPPESMRFIMIDPKRVELTLYNKIPHLLTPVITEAKKAILSLKWAAREMDRRYDVLETESVRDIASYHKNVYEPAVKKHSKKNHSDQASDSEIPEKMPYIVIIIDELADIMTAYPRELESAIVRLAQMSRAVGIHLVLSTQRPSVNVITGLIKANIPSRIALQVSSQIDSRTILDTSGAEKLLGAGDMLYMSGEMGKPVRIQSAFISENEVKKVVKFLVDGYRDEVPDEIILSESAIKDTLFESGLDEENSEEDELYEEARETVLQAQKASSSYLQRKLKVGYARAARLLDMLEDNGVIGPANGSKPRDILADDNGEYENADENEEI